MQHKFDRLIKVIGSDNFNFIKNKKVLVLGLGGVGGYIVEGLIRSGIENIIIIDSDIVEESNMNRQIIATNKTLGKNKVDVLKAQRIIERVKFLSDDIELISKNRRVELNKVQQ